ncbi:MAG: hypothetical protein QXU46_03540 [Candidatus Bathyarchaeia archaeon]
MKKIFIKKYSDVLEAAKEGEQRCFSGKRWEGHVPLIIIDTALDSIGLNYFKIVVPRVRLFYKNFIENGKIKTLEDLSKLNYKNALLRKIINHDRVWKAAIDISETIEQIRKRNALKNDFFALRQWATNANYRDWKNDPIGKIFGVGFISFQYLRMQAGVDTTVPDKIIRRAFEQNFGLKTPNEIEFVEKAEFLSNELGFSQTMICWAIWLKEARVSDLDWEEIA